MECLAEDINYMSSDGTLFITLDGKYHNVIEAVNNSDENEESIKSLKQQIENYNLILYLTDSLETDVTNQIMIASTQNEITKQTPDLKSFANTKIDSYYNSYIETLKENNYDIVESKILKTQNNNTYIAYETKAEDSNYSLDSYTYDTIINQTLISINISFINTEASWQKANDIIERLEFNSVQNNVKEEDLATYAAILAIILLIVIITIKRKSKNIESSVLAENTKIKYRKFRGFLICFIVVLALNTLYRTVDIMYLSSLKISAFTLLFIVQEAVSIIFNFIIAILLFRRRDKTSKRVETLLFISCIISLIFLFLIVCSALASDIIVSKDFYITTILYMLSIAIYSAIWIIYFKKSKRVKEYYNI